MTSLATLLVAFCFHISTAHADWHQRTDAIMGTRIFVELWHDDAVTAQRLMQQVMDEMHRIDELMSPYKETAQLFVINRDAAQKPVAITPELFDLIQVSNHYSDLSGGAFDITFASLGHQFDYRKQVRPDEAHRKSGQALINYKALQLDAKKHTVFFPHPGMRIDLGGIAKGYAVDKAIAILQQASVTNAIVTAGGDSRLLGDRRGRPWLMGIKHPRADSHAITLPLDNISISTSGDYERYFEEDGVRFHHIIDPKKGDSPRELVSTTILANNSTEADALSTTLFILGVEKGLALANRLPGVSAILIDHAGKVHYSDDLAPPAASAPVR
ncbi:MAG: FAD:protein FMN transferase [Gammaproteobacteria bacterium]|nr:FAD:protein FMN transferase [Gammaproteobacteria bacterium]